MKLCCSLLTAGILILFSGNAIAQAGALDSAFSGTGKVVTAIGASDDFNQSIAIQPDGKIIAAGYSNVGTFNNDFGLARYNADGSLDDSFGNGGRVINGSGADEKAFGMTLQPDGKIVLIGSSNYGSNSDLAVVRFNANGILDNSFGGNGIVITDLGGAFDKGNSVVVQPDGKIVVAGVASGGNASYNDFAVVRYESDGSIDNSFGIGGIVKTDLRNMSSDVAYSVLLQSDGKIVVAGVAVLSSGGDFGLVRYNTNGALDNTFGTRGIVITPIGNAGDEAYAAAIQSDGKIILAGTSNNGADYDFALARYNTDGSLDNTFDLEGKVRTTSIRTNDLAEAIAIQADGKIVIAGLISSGNGTDFGVLRYNTNGSLDNAFGFAGKVITPIGLTSDDARSVAIQSDGKIIAGGSTLFNNYEFALVRYMGDVKLGVFEQNNNNALSAYYDARNCELIINGTDDKGEVKIMDLTGKEILRQDSADQKTKLRIGKIVPGYYIMNYVNVNQTAKLRFAVFN